MSNGIAVMRQPLPHEHEHKVLKSSPVFRIQCSCGYDGFSTSETDCPQYDVHLKAYEREQHGAVETAVASMPQSALDNLINAAVANALENYKKSVAKETEKGGKS